MPNDRSILGLVIETQTVGQAEIDKLSSSFNKFADSITKQSARIEQENSRAAASFAKFQSSIQNPLSTVTKSVTDFTLGYGKMGLVVAGTATAIALGARELAKITIEQGKAAESAINFAERLNISVGEGQRLSAMARIAGVDIGFLQNASARLAATLEDQGEKGDKARKALAELGIITQTGVDTFRDIDAVTLDVVKGLAGIDDSGRRAALGMALLNRGFNEITPVLRHFRDLDKAVRDLGIGLDENGTQRLADFDDEIDKLGISWDELKRKLAAGIAPIAIPILGLAGSDVTKRAVDYDITAAGDPFKGLDKYVDIGKTDLNKVATNPDIERGQKLGADYITSQLKTAEGQAAQLAILQKKRADLDKSIRDESVPGSVKVDAKQRLADTDSQIAGLKADIKLRERRLQLDQEITKLEEKATADAQIRGLGKDAVPASVELLRQNARTDLTAADKAKIGSILSPEIVAQQAEADKKAQEIIAKLSAQFQAQQLATRQQGIGSDSAQSIAAIGAAAPPGEEIDAQRLIAQVRTDAAKRIFEIEQKRIELEHAGDDGKVKFLNTMIDLSKARGDKDKEIGDADADRDAKILAIERERTELAKQRGRDLGVAQLADREQRIQGDADRQIRFLQTSAKPGQEISTALQVEQLRQDAAQKVFDLEVQRLDVATRDMDAEQQQSTREVENIKLIADLEKSRQDASLEYWDSVLSLQRQQEQQSRDAAGRTFDAITASGKDAFAQLGQTVLKTFERQVFVNITSVAYDQARKAASTAIPGQVDPKTGNLTTLGKIFQGTPLGIDPLKQATIDQTRATRDLTNEFRKYNTGSSSGGSIPTLLDRPLLRTPGFSPEDDLKDSKAVKDASDKEADVQKEGTAAIKSLTNKLIGIGGAAAIGAAGVVGGVAQGGVQGAVSAAGSIATTLGTVLPQISKSLSIAGPIGAIAGLGLSLVSSLLPNAKAKFDSEQDATIQKNAYVAPTAQSQTADATGTATGTNLRGAPNVTVQFNVSTIDTKGVKAFFDAHSTTIAELVGKATQNGQSPNMTMAINKTAFPSA